MFKSIENETESEIIEKKSRFIAHLIAVNSKEEAESAIKKIKIKYKDARHNCYAYVIENIEKCSDDGEPSGTAGAPLLDLLKKNNLQNIMIIVTRYFGGILLGTGGLVRAYTDSAKKAIEKANIVEKEYGIEYEIEIEYKELKQLQYLCNQLNINIIKIEYKINILLTLQSNELKRQKLLENNIKILKETIIDKRIIIQKL